MSHKDALVLESSDPGCDYVLQPGHQGAWVSVDNLSVYIVRRPGGIAVEIYAAGCEILNPIDSAEAYFDDAEAIQVRENV
jgi:hypothetical protein